MKNDTADSIRQGQLFVVPEAATIETRGGSEFEPQGSLDTPPDSVTGVTGKNNVLAMQNLHLEALPIKGLRASVIAVAALLLVLLGWPLVSGLQAVFQWHPLWGLVCLLASTLVASLVGYTLWQFCYAGDQLEKISALQTASVKLKSHKSFGKATAFIADMSLFYAGKPQDELWQKALKQLPDYANDGEIIAHFEQTFIQVLDKEALRRVARYSCQTATSVAVSPWAGLDMLLSLLRNLKMISEIGQVYGLRPTLLNRYKLLKQVVLHLIGSGASEFIVDQAVQELGASGLANIVGLRLTQGLGAGIYSAKIGLSAIQASRPVEFSTAEKPKLKHLLATMLVQLKRVFGEKE